MRIRHLIAAAAMVAASLGPIAASAAMPAHGSLIKGSGPAVYWYSQDGKRYVFPNEKTYFSWYADFSGVVTVTDAELASVMIGGNVTYKPGVRMLKIQSDPKTYVVDAGGTLRWVKDEATAIALYGSAWASYVQDVPDAFFINYRLGADVNAAADFDPTSRTAAAISIDTELSARALPPATTPPPVTPPVTTPPVTINNDIPDTEGTVDAGLVVAGKSSQVLARFRLTASLEELKLTKVRIALQSATSARSIKSMSLYDGHVLVGGPMQVDSSGNADFTDVNFVTPRNGSNTLTVAADLNTVSQGAVTDDNVGVIFHVPFSDDGTYESRGTSSSTVLKNGTTGDLPGNVKLVRKTNVFVANAALPTTTLLDGDAIASRVTFTADNAEQVSLKKLTWIVSKPSAAVITNPILREVGGSTVATNATLTGCGAASTSCTVSLAATSEFIVANGGSRTMELRLNIAGTASNDSIQTSLQGDVTDAKGALSNTGAGIAGNTSFNFIWSDNSTIPHNDADAGSNDWFSGIYVKNLPSDVQTLSR